ncbi:MAG: AI-2E family transporter [Butyrivibrio sp.]|nr:AI-2E family transporter [Butyrivibrio sp.]
MKFNKNWFNRNWFPYTVATCSAVILYLLLSHINILFDALGVLFKYFTPVITGIIIAYLLSPLVGFYEKELFKRTKNTTLKRTLSVILAVATVILVIALLIIALIPQIVDSTTSFISNIDSYATSLEAMLNSLSLQAGNFHLDISGITSKINTFLSQFSQRLPSILEQAISVSAGIGRNVTNSILGFILAMYFLMGHERIMSGTKRLARQFLSPQLMTAIGTFWDKCDKILLQYITFDLLDGLIVGVVNWLFMLFTGMSYSVLISVVVGVTNLAPTFGPILGAIIGSFILVLVNPFHALLFLIFTIVLQTLDGYVIKPKLFGGSLNVPSIWILVTLVVGGRMFGVAGIMLAIPFAAIFNVVYTNWIEKREAAQALKAEADKEE